ncbi:MAG: hypothetical protein SPE85_05535, partial [Prevotella sp.]|nr:hypothetical protein [Prevotella sp.]
MRHITIILSTTIALMLSGCANPDADRIMDRAEAIMYSAPDSAMQALDSLAATASSLPKSQRMRHALLT